MSKTYGSHSELSIALEKCLPNFAQVHRFGAGGKLNNKYPGNLWNKLNLLAKDLGSIGDSRICQRERLVVDAGSSKRCKRAGKSALPRLRTL